MKNKGKRNEESKERETNAISELFLGSWRQKKKKKKLGNNWVNLEYIR